MILRESLPVELVEDSALDGVFLTLPHPFLYGHARKSGCAMFPVMPL
jgi:hypothetical protein